LIDSMANTFIGTRSYMSVSWDTKKDIDDNKLIFSLL
jgi:hypothetical protein